MKKDKFPKNIHKLYHAHVYFDEATRNDAKALCELIVNSFNFRVGKFHEKPIGPHPMWSCQITFEVKDFDVFIPWLDVQRKNLTVFVHGLTGDDLQDHTDYAYWLGQSVTLNLEMFVSE